MIIDSKKAQQHAVLEVAQAICVAARTAPKTAGIDQTDTVVVTGDDKKKLADEMRALGRSLPAAFFIRDADNVDASDAVVLVGAQFKTRGINGICQLCGFEDCAAATKAGATSVFSGIDLGIALGSAVALAADARVDNRIMFSIGKAAASLGLLGDFSLIMGIPLSVSGKSPFFDRK
jgi:uncharacterized ferredoxin-like protein